MTDDFTIEPEAVITAGNNLKTMGETLKNGRHYGDATGAEAYDVFGAVDGFRDKWDNALTRLQKSIGDIGEATVAIAQAYKEDDQQRSKIFKPQDGGGAPSTQKPR